jgi:Arginase family
VRISHGTPFRVACEEGALLGRNIVPVGLGGTWPGPDLFEWMGSAGFRWHTMDEIVERGVSACRARELTLRAADVVEVSRRTTKRGSRRSPRSAWPSRSWPGPPPAA